MNSLKYRFGLGALLVFLLYSFSKSQDDYDHSDEIYHHGDNITRSYLSLKELISRADSIFIGRLLSVNKETIAGKVEIRKSDFEIISPLKGITGGNAKKIFELKENWLMRTHFDPDATDLYLLFISKKDEFGLNPPVGIFSGTFFIFSEEDDDDSWAINCNSNSGLWDHHKSLWDSGFSRFAVLSELIQMGLSQIEANYLVKIGDNPNQNITIRLEFLIAAIKSSVK